MSSIEHYSSAAGMLPTRAERSLARSLASVRGTTTVQIARIDAAAQRHEAVVDGLTSVTARALQHAALVSQAEQSLAQSVPHASGRLAAIADVHALAMQATVMDAARALGRLA